jgi:hypothetical protein
MSVNCNYFFQERQGFFAQFIDFTHLAGILATPIDRCAQHIFRNLIKVVQPTSVRTIFAVSIRDSLYINPHHFIRQFGLIIALCGIAPTRDSDHRTQAGVRIDFVKSDNPSVCYLLGQDDQAKVVIGSRRVVIWVFNFFFLGNRLSVIIGEIGSAEYHVVISPEAMSLMLDEFASSEK